MILVSACVFSSCAKIKEDEVVSDTDSTLKDTLFKTYAAFFGDDMGAFNALKGYMEKGSLTVEGENVELGESYSITTYNNKYSKDEIIEASFDTEDFEGNLRFLLTQNAAGLYFPELLGSDATIAFVYDTVINGFASSSIADMLELTQEQINDVIGYALDLKEFMSGSAEDADEEEKSLINDLHKNFNQEVATEKVDVNGESVKCVVVTNTVTNANLRAAAIMIIDSAFAPNLDAQEVEDLKASINDYFDDYDENTQVNFKQQICINTKTDTIAKYSIEYSETDVESGTEETTKTHLTIGETEMKGAFSQEGTDVEYASGEYTLTKSTSGDDVTYKFLVTGNTETVTVKLLDLTHTYNKASGDFTVNANVFAEGFSPDKHVIKGNAKATSDTADIVISSISKNGVSEPITYRITMKALSELPTIPEDAIDLADASQAQIQGLLADLMSTDLGAWLIEYIASNMMSK